MLFRNSRFIQIQKHTYPFLAQFQDNIDVKTILEKAMEFYNIRMIKATMYGDFLGHFLLLIVFHHKLFGNYFASINIVCDHIDDFVTFCKAALDIDKRGKGC